MVELLNKDAIADLYSDFNVGGAGFYIITASSGMQKYIANSFAAENVAVYDYSGRENKFSSKDIIYFIEINKEKEVFFILNFQIPFLGKEPKTQQEDYFALNLCRDALCAYNKKIFFFVTRDIERNISTSAMDFFDYCFSKIDFEDEKKDEIERQIKNLNEDYRNIHHKAEIEYRLNLYKDKIEEYLNIEDEKISKPIDKKAENYLLVAARDLSYFAKLYRKISNFDKALELLYKTLNIREQIQGVEHTNTADIYNSIGFVYDSQGDYSKALEYYQKALKIWDKVSGNEHSDVAAAYNNIGYVYYCQGDYSKALEYYQKALKIWEKVFGDEHPDVAISYNNIGVVYNKQGDHSKALEYHQKALKIQEKVLNNEHPDVALSYHNIGAVYDDQGDYSKALEYYQKALKIREKVLGSNHPDTVNTYNAIEKINNKKKPEL